MIRLEKREDKSSDHHHEFDIYHRGENGKEKKVGRAFFHREEDGWTLAMMERQKVPPKRYDDYPNLSQEAITALVGKAKELGINSFLFGKRKQDAEEFHSFLREIGFSDNGKAFELSFAGEGKKGALRRLFQFLKE